jgi:hypothetical protein
MQTTSIPGWAALGCGNMIEVDIPESVHELIILADNDDNGESERAAYRTAQRWVRTIKVSVVPAPEGKDFNDVLRESRDE